MAADGGSDNGSVLLNDGNWATVPAPPTLSISDTTVTEGDTGTLTPQVTHGCGRPRIGRLLGTPSHLAAKKRKE